MMQGSPRILYAHHTVGRSRDGTPSAFGYRQSSTATGVAVATRWSMAHRDSIPRVCDVVRKRAMW